VRTLRKEQGVPDLDTSEAAAYLADMSGSLAVIARQHGFDTLAYLFEMAQEEAQNNALSPEGRRPRQ
jgi:hypothetical protein